ncbi:MAG: hypothetical protein M5U01_04835 [Ardenticatenaceae bacterium]|nr:hypothetical protein [Ardenticatenaceae bacterium]
MSPGRRFALAGLAGFLLAAILSLIAWFVPTFVPALIAPARVGGPTIPRLVLLGLGFLAVAELPLLLIAMVRLSYSAQGQTILNLTHLAYVAFPAVYGLLGSGLTGERWWAGLMFILAPVRLVMSLLAVQVPPPAKVLGRGDRK